MKVTVKNISLTFSAGCVGGLMNMLAVWLSGLAGLTQALGVKIAPQLTAPWLYNRLTWGGLWGLMFLWSMRRLSYPVRGLLYCLAPSLVQLFVVFPFQAHKGVLGLQLGYLTPVVVLIFNAVWGLAAGAWLQLTMAE